MECITTPFLSVHKYKRDFVTPNKCMYSGDMDLTKSKCCKQNNHEGPLAPLTNNNVCSNQNRKEKKDEHRQGRLSWAYSCIQHKVKQVLTVVWVYSFFHLLKTSICCPLFSFGDCLVWEIRTLPPLFVRKFFPGCTQKPHP